MLGTVLFTNVWTALLHAVPMKSMSLGSINSASEPVRLLSVNGLNSNYGVEVTVENVSSDTISIFTDRGSIIRPSKGVQAMVIAAIDYEPPTNNAWQSFGLAYANNTRSLSKYTWVLKPKEKKTLKLNALCIEHKKSVPGTTNYLSDVSFDKSSSTLTSVFSAVDKVQKQLDADYKATASRTDQEKLLALPTLERQLAVLSCVPDKSGCQLIPAAYQVAVWAAEEKATKKSIASVLTKVPSIPVPSELTTPVTNTSLRAMLPPKAQAEWDELTSIEQTILVNDLEKTRKDVLKLYSGLADAHYLIAASILDQAGLDSSSIK